MDRIETPFDFHVARVFQIPRIFVPQKSLAFEEASYIRQRGRRLVHAAHAAAAGHTAAGARALLLVFLDVRHQSFGGEHQAGDRSGVLQSEASDLGRVDHACLDQVAVLARIRVEAEVVVLRFADAADNRRRLLVRR